MTKSGGTHPDNPGIVVIGAGPVGLVAAMYLAREHGPVTVLEKRPDPRPLPHRAGRSITVMLSARGWHVLTDLGLAEAVRSVCVPIHGRRAHFLDGGSHTTPYSRDWQPIWSVERERLHRLLLDAAEADPGIRLRFGHRVREVRLDEPAVVVGTAGGTATLPCRRVLGCDGAHSAARSALVAAYAERGGGPDGVREEVRTLGLAHQEIHVPAGWIDPWTMHYWPTGDGLFAAFPLPSGEFAGSLFLRVKGPAPSYEALRDDDDLRALVAARFPGPAAAIPDLGAQLARNRAATITTVRCDRFRWRDRLALLGDASHAMAPFMGQGMNCGFEDARVLREALASTGDWESALAAYEESRTADAEAISYLSDQHYHTMANPPLETENPARDALRERLYALCPERFAPLYEQCAFTEESYATLLREDRAFEELVDGLLRAHGPALASAPASTLSARLAEVSTTRKDHRCS
ncbi:FAD-dependent oxidoreductase [Streptomyces sp. NPDC091383]|uniref:FAD-dependent oxidoreductase n=1 Tax=Streptomyces sp. NPDC091383 TaxID=3365996 RepID=UPI00380AB044